MAWWKSDDNRLIGDDPLDELEEFLSRFSDLYLEDQGRKPTLDELLTCLRLVLGNSLEDFFSSPSGVIITELTAKTKSRPKRPKLRPGAVFCVPIGSGLLAFGRLTPQSGVAEFYRVKSHNKLSVRVLERFPVFRLKSMIPDKAFRDGHWLIYDFVDYQIDSFIFGSYRLGNQIACGRKVINGFVDTSSEKRPATESEMETVPALAIYNQAMAEDKLRQALSDAPVI